MSGYNDEKSPLAGIEVLPVPATYTVERKRPSFFGRLLRFVAIFFITFSTINYLVPATSRYVRHAYGGCHHGMKKMGDHDHQHPFPPVDKWKPYEGTTHFEYKPEEAAGFSVRGTNTFGKVVFETSKVSDKIVIDLDIKTDRKDKHGDVSIEEKDGYLTVNVPSSGDLKTYTSATIQVPSNIIGTFGLESFDLNLPQHMIDYSGLPESLEIGSLTVRAAKGFVKTGPVKTNSTQITVGNGAVKGTIHQARDETKLDVAKGNVTLEVTGISSGNEGRFNAKLANGHLKGSYVVYNSTTLDVVSGTIYANVRFESADDQHRGELSTKVASGSSRIFVDSIADYRLIESHHDTINGDQVLTYPENFVGTIDARGIAGDIKLAGKDVVVEKVLGGLKGTKGDSERNYIGAKSAKGSIDILIGKDE